MNGQIEKAKKAFNKADGYALNGQYDKAIEHYKKALEINIKELGENDPSVAGIYNSLGLAYYSKGERENADACFQKAKSIDEHNNIIT